MDERRLAEKLKARSRPALDQAVRRFTPYVGTVICRTLSGRAAREDVEELTADVFLALWEHAPDLDPAQGLRPWLAAVARNQAVDFLRRLAGDICLVRSMVPVQFPMLLCIAACMMIKWCLVSQIKSLHFIIKKAVRF